MDMEKLNDYADELTLYAKTLESQGMALDFVMEKPEPNQVLERVCTIYKKVRPFLELIGSFFFLPKKWRSAINTFVLVMDGVCQDPE